MAAPSQHRAKLHSTNPLERLNKEVKRRADVVGIIPNEPAIVCLIGAVLLEQNDERQLQHRYMQLEAMAELTSPTTDADPLHLSPKAAWLMATSACPTNSTTLTDVTLFEPPRGYFTTAPCPS